ncbi:hypothetical protein H310_07849 [Aphanomyces invadans]|uniref:Myb-like domain-containing protein n=1 Tax=Aphanomyces invadans TaxID=157072 RepID=A0A024U2G2_9STRA|nr:hypothetical protein H310_07849 [Aphanomyces invadans]ETV99807.1 hypothetical protein H310_07849 [Aphanomyces invadans]|eukprot:XP_008871583.1 hypothetical protein H310_07849 [Aphanomyces invadans]
MKSAKKKPAHRFTLQQDVDLIKEVISVSPHDAPYGQLSTRWAEVGQNMQAIYASNLTASGCQKRCDELLVAFHKDNIASLRASGTEENYNEREQLLQDLSDMIDSIADKKRTFKEEKGKKEDKRETDGHMIREATMVAMSRGTADTEVESSDTEGSSSTSAKRVKRSSVKGATNAIAAFMESANKCKSNKSA